MGKAILLREDFDGDQLRELAKASPDGRQVRRLLALSVIYDGGSRTDAARIGGVGLQIVRDWVLRFNAEGPPGLLDHKSPGALAKLNGEHLAALAHRVHEGAELSRDGVVRWRLKDLKQWIYEKFGIVVSEGTVSRALKKLGFTLLTARPRHVHQDKQAVEEFKKTSAMRSRVLAPNIDPEHRWKSGGKMKPGWGRKPRPPEGGPRKEPVRLPRSINGRSQPISLAPFARNAGSALALSCLTAIPGQ